jgi:hypothetical protein
MTRSINPGMRLCPKSDTFQADEFVATETNSQVTYVALPCTQSDSILPGRHKRSNCLGPLADMMLRTASSCRPPHLCSFRLAGLPEVVSEIPVYSGILQRSPSQSLCHLILL